MPRFPSLRMRLALWAYQGLWWVGLPLVLAYLWRRGRRDPVYLSHLAERFGSYGAPPWPADVWIHAVSLGEMRSATPIIRALLAEGRRVVLTHFTPAGRSESAKVFGPDIAAGRVRAVWVPFEYGWTFRRFFRAFRPRVGLVMEIEIWPGMIMAARRAGVPLYMCNAQYPSKSFARDTTRTGLRAELMRGFAGALVKSDLQRDRFASVGVPNITVTGETRFDQPVPPHLIAAGRTARAALAPNRPVLTIASAILGEDALYLDAIAPMRARVAARGGKVPLVVYVPRAPERFDEVARMIADRGLRVVRRSEAFGAALEPVRLPEVEIDVLLGDSLGEMYFYLEMADRVVVGGGFTPKGAHNIIEPLALRRPVIVGPETWTIEYPAEEAIAAGVCLRVPPEGLADAVDPDGGFRPDPETIESFFVAHSGATARTLAAIRPHLP